MARPSIYVGRAATPLAREAGQFIHSYYEKEYQAELEALENDESKPSMTPLPSIDNMCVGQTKNPFSLIVVKDKEGRIRGVVELWTIIPKRLDSLLNGYIDESNLTPDDFLEYSQNITEFYAAITAPPLNPYKQTTEDGDIIAGCLCGVFTTLRETYLNQKKGERKNAFITLYALEASEKGGEFMMRLNFQLIKTARTDNQPVLKLDVSPAMIEAQSSKWKKRDFVFQPAPLWI